VGIMFTYILVLNQFNRWVQQFKSWEDSGNYLQQNFHESTILVPTWIACPGICIRRCA
jgi:hypothetical protein